MFQDVSAALNGQLGDMDTMCNTLTERYDAHVTQAVLRLLQHAQTVQDIAEHEAKVSLRDMYGVR